MNYTEMIRMSRTSEISIMESKDTLQISINGYGICDVIYSENHPKCLIKSKDDAIEISKEIVNLLESKYGEVKEKDYPNPFKAPMNTKCVEGYELGSICTSEEEEQEQFIKAMMVSCGE